MIQRNVVFLLQADGSVTPSVPQYGGVKGEHNVTKLEFSMNTGQTYKEGDLLRLSFCLGDGTVLSSDLLDVKTDESYNRTQVKYALPQTLTMAGGQLCVRLVMSRMDATGKEIEVFRSGEAVVYFDEAPVENGTPFWMGVSEMLKRTTTAKDEAVTAKEEAFNAYLEANKERKKAEEARDAAVDAYHETTQDIAEQNKVLEDMQKTVSANASSIKTHESMLNAASEYARKISQDIDAQNQRLQDVEKVVQTHGGMLNAAATYSQSLAGDIAANASAIAANKKECDDRVESTIRAVVNIGLSKLDKSGHEPDMFLGTDGNGNVVEKEAQSGVWIGSAAKYEAETIPAGTVCFITDANDEPETPDEPVTPEQSGVEQNGSVLFVYSNVSAVQNGDTVTIGG